MFTLKGWTMCTVLVCLMGDTAQIPTFRPCGEINPYFSVFLKLNMGGHVHVHSGKYVKGLMLIKSSYFKDKFLSIDSYNWIQSEKNYPEFCSFSCLKWSN